ncbi:MAG: phage tail tape measure protein [Planctomycetia bacterium]|jgi:TP901 family phage tail tape measure protein
MSAADIKAGAAFVEVYVNNSRLVRGLKAAQRRLRGFSVSVTAVGRRMMATSGLMSMPFIAGTKVFADFEQQMASVATMLDEPTKHMDRFKTRIREMSIEFGESTETLAKGLYDILSASVAPEKALDVLAVAAKAAKAGMTDTGTAADAITTLLNAYGMSADRAGEVSDLLFSIVKRGKTTFAELAPSIGLVATTAATAGVSTEELGAALATMTRNGVKTDNAITAVQAIISSFLKPAAEASDYARTLGFEMSVTTLQAEGLEGIFKKISHLPPDAIAKLFPNVRALRGVLPALKNMQGFAGDLAVMANRAGATDEAFGKMSKTLATSLARLKQSAMVMLSMIGEALAEGIGKAAKGIMRITGHIQNFIQKNKSLVVSIAKVVLIVGAIGTVLVTLGMSAGVLAFAFGGLVSIITAFVVALKLVAVVVAAILSPIGLLVAAIAAIGTTILVTTGAGGKALAWLGNKFSALKELAGQAWKGIGAALAAGDIALAGRILWLSLKIVFQKGINTLLKLWLDFKTSALSVWVKLKASVQKLWQELWFALKEVAIKTGLAEPILKTFHALESGWLKVTQFFSRLWLNMCSGIMKAWNRVSRSIKSVQSWMAEKVVGVMAFFDESIDEEAAKRAVREQFNAEQRQLDAELAKLETERAAKAKQLDEEQASETKDLEAKQAARMVELQRQKSIGNQGRRDEMRQAQADIDAAAEKELAGLEAQATSDLNASAEELKRARAEWKAAIAEAAQKREGQKSGEGNAGPGSTPKIAELEAKLKQAGPAVTKASDSIATSGTFSAQFAGRMSAGNAATRTANAIEKLLEEQERHNKRVEAAERGRSKQFVFTGPSTSIEIPSEDP